MLSRRSGAENLTPGAPIRTACVEEESAAGLGRAGGDGGMLMVSLAAEARAAAPRSEMIEGICMLDCCHDVGLCFTSVSVSIVDDVGISKV